MGGELRRSCSLLQAVTRSASEAATRHKHTYGHKSSVGMQLGEL